MVRLPVSGLDLTLRQPAGAEDILLLETPANDAGLALKLVSRLAESIDRTVVNWGDLSVSDLEFLLLILRQIVFGDWIGTDAICPAPWCGKRVDVSFRISDYLSHHVPRRSPTVTCTETPGWFQLRNTAVTFRLPTVADRIAIAYHPQPEQELRQRCIKPGDISAKLRRRVETAMAALAPNLSDDLQGQCVECGTAVTMFFDVEQFTLQELRRQAAFIYEEVHLLASSYKWSEDAILALPHHRRQQYAERVRQAWRSA
ncbi:MULTISPECIES: hypothetical protein [unclassified Microcoleus]|uniref:hypothetical protein n=1 Tax=unclassified Microcoleus TaxID=2642155 RepID=UPI002FD52949